MPALTRFSPIKQRRQVWGIPLCKGHPSSRKAHYNSVSFMASIRNFLFTSEKRKPKRPDASLQSELEGDAEIRDSLLSLNHISLSNWVNPIPRRTLCKISLHFARDEEHGGWQERISGPSSQAISSPKASENTNRSQITPQRHLLSLLRTLFASPVLFSNYVALFLSAERLSSR